MRVHDCLGAGVAVFGLALTGQAQVLDFQHLEVANGSVNNVGEVVTEDGFQVTKDPGEPHQFAVFGTQESRYPGSTALFNNTVNGVIRISAIDGSPFDVESIDVAMLNGAGSVALHLVGNVSGGGQVTQTINHSDGGLPLDLITYTLNGFVNLDSIEWTQESPYHQFDNVVISQGGYRLSITGECPGTVTLRWRGATPSRQQAIVFALSTGSFRIPNGPCQGTVLGLGSQGLRLINTIGTGNGEGTINGRIGTGACGGYLQLVELPSCTTSNVAQLP